MHSFLVDFPNKKKSWIFATNSNFLVPTILGSCVSQRIISVRWFGRFNDFWLLAQGAGVAHAISKTLLKKIKISNFKEKTCYPQGYPATANLAN